MNDTETRRAAVSLAALAKEIRACRICCDSPRGPPLAHQPRPVFQVSKTATICIAGQAPGTRVHASGRPFTDPSGDRLRDWMEVDEDTFYDRRKVAIVPMGFCFPGQDARGADLPPRRECAPAWRGSLIDRLDRVTLLLAVGAYAQRWHLRGSGRRSLTEIVRGWRQIVRTTDPMIIPLPHPSWRNNAWIKKNPWFDAELIPFLRSEIAARLDTI
ncbi:MAG: uracil-DNA glycosylase family protein [Hyphomicrobiales bacterium]|nr:uracil-DNA glycosylase family protein [Hyphomicrobiales bacterium]